MSCPFWSTVLQCGTRLPIHTVSGARFLTGGVFECDISHRRSVAVLCMLYKIRCYRYTRLMMRYLDRMCQCGLHAVPWSHIVTLKRRLAAEPCSTEGVLFRSQCPSGTILLIPYSMVWDWRFQEQGQCFFIGLSCSIPTIASNYFSRSLLSVYWWYCGADVFGLIWCIWLYLSLALPTFLNNNDNN